MNNVNNVDLPEKARDGIVKLAKKCEIEKVILFGSRARGDNHPRSDIDIAIKGGNTTEFAIDIDDEIETLLMFDVVDLDRPTQKSLLNSIEKEGVLIYGKT